MMYRFIFIAFIGFISIALCSAGLSSSAEVKKYKPVPPFSGGPGTGGLGDRTGSPVSSGTCAACHSGGVFNTSVAIQILSGGNPVTSYTPGNTYTVAYTVTGTASAYGFQGGALTNSNAAGGTFSAPSTNAQTVTIAGRPYIEHDNGPSATGVFTATWTAPAANSGTINFYGIGLGVNNNGGTSGDHVSSTALLTLPESVPTTITYAGNPFCSDDPNQTPQLTGITNGTFSSTAGLTIDANTGVINVSTSTAGSYVVNYNYGTGTTTTSVTINPIYTLSSIATICDNDSLTFGTQVLYASNAGLNTQTLQSVTGCDSIINLTLTVLPTYNANITATICPGDTYDFNGQILDETNAGLNTQVLSAANGCDSTVNLTLTVQTVDNTVTATGGVLTANQTGATYQWLDCDNANAPISGETNAVFTAISSGNYAVEVTLNNCSDTSSCQVVDFTGLKELSIEPKELIMIIDLMGREVVPQKNVVLIYIYSDGTKERVFEME